MKNFSKPLAVFMALVMVFTLNPIKSNAKWKDGSGDLPGMVDDGTIIALGAAAVVGIGVLVYVLVKKKKQDQATSALENRKTMETILWENQIIKLAKDHQGNLSTSQRNEFCELPASFAMPQNTVSQQMENAKNTLPVDLVVAPLSNTNFAMGQTNGVQVGLRIRF